ncbi:MAG TPA: hypothetical protein VMB71_12955 [Acetobacteraceae bacterium]|nr:hypothetical protein [Acetobacteraceae bacterium]
MLRLAPLRVVYKQIKVFCDSFFQKRTKKLLSVTGSAKSADLDWLLDAIEKSLLLLFFRKEVLPCLFFFSLHKKEHIACARKAAEFAINPAASLTASAKGSAPLRRRPSPFRRPHGRAQ